MLGQERRVHLGLGIKTQMNMPFLGHVGAMFGLCGTYVGAMLHHVEHIWGSVGGFRG